MKKIIFLIMAVMMLTLAVAGAQEIQLGTAEDTTYDVGLSGAGTLATYAYLNFTSDVDYDLTGIELYVSATSGSPPLPFYVSLRSGPSDFNAVNGTNITSTFVNASDLSTSAYNTITFDTPETLTAGTQYWIALEPIVSLVLGSDTVVTLSVDTSESPQNSNAWKIESGGTFSPLQRISDDSDFPAVDGHQFLMNLTGSASVVFAPGITSLTNPSKTNDSIYMEWTAENTTHFDLDRNGTLLLDDSTLLNYNDTGLLGDTGYLYTLVAYNTTSGLNDTDTLLVTTSTTCDEAWDPIFSACSVYDNQTLTYNDTNACGTFADLPSDNGTVSACNYCTLAYTETVGTCGSGESTADTVYDIDNYASCCALTGFSADCDVPETNSTNSCAGIHSSSDMPAVVIDTLVEFGIGMIQFMPVIAVLAVGFFIFGLVMS